MKLVMVSDIHLRPDNPVGRLDYLPDVQWNKLREVFEIARRVEAAGIIQSGDLFHKPRSWATLYWILELFAEYRDVRWYGVRGQHDVYMNETSSEGTNFGILTKVGAIRELDSRAHYIEGRDGLVALYGSSWGQEVPEIKDKRDVNILVTHRSISDEELVGVQTTSASRFLRLHRFDLILCGDIHRAFVVNTGKRVLVNTGPMLRFEATDYNFKHIPHVMIYDVYENTLERIDLTCDPSEKVLSRVHLDIAQDTRDRLAEFVGGVQTEFSPEVSFKENLLLFYKENNVSESVRLRIQKTMEGLG